MGTAMVITLKTETETETGTIKLMEQNLFSVISHALPKEQNTGCNGRVPDSIYSRTENADEYSMIFNRAVLGELPHRRIVCDAGNTRFGNSRQPVHGDHTDAGLRQNGPLSDAGYLQSKTMTNQVFIKMVFHAGLPVTWLISTNSNCGRHTCPMGSEWARRGAGAGHTANRVPEVPAMILEMFSTKLQRYEICP